MSYHTKFHVEVGKMPQIVGIIKEIDNLGRIVIPKEYRNLLMLDKQVEIVLTEDGVLIRNPLYKLMPREEK
jgi:AbrB family looped-hinge helix DNA binding protein